MDKSTDTWISPQWEAREYLEACREAVEDDVAFASFRGDHRYRRVLEHARPDEGIIYYEKACAIDRAFVLENFHTFRENDLYGGAAIVRHPFGLISIASVRYIYLLNEIRRRVGPLEGADIVEIGGGYGGQCRMIMDVCKPRSYTIFDLGWPLLLTKKYLSKYGLDERVSLREYGDFDDIGNIDVVISTWAFCELTEPARDAYCFHVIRNSQRGCTTWNTPHDWFVKYLQSQRRFNILTEPTSHALFVQWRENLNVG